MDAVNQTVQQAAEQAKNAGQKGMVMFMFISKFRTVKSQTGPPTLLCSLSHTWWERGSCCNDATVTFVFFSLKALDEVYKVAETGEKAVKNVANQATSWGKSFGQ